MKHIVEHNRWNELGLSVLKDFVFLETGEAGVVPPPLDSTHFFCYGQGFGEGFAAAVLNPLMNRPVPSVLITDADVSDFDAARFHCEIKPLGRRGAQSAQFKQHAEDEEETIFRRFLVRRKFNDSHVPSEDEKVQAAAVIESEIKHFIASCLSANERPNYTRAMGEARVLAVVWWGDDVAHAIFKKTDEVKDAMTAAENVFLNGDDDDDGDDD